MRSRKWRTLDWTMMADREILELYRNTQTREQGFALLVRTYSTKIYWHVRRMVTDHDDANDVVQNCFLKAWKGLPQFKENSKLYTWLYRIATNEAITFIQDTYRRNTVAVESEEQAYMEDLSSDAWFDGDELQKQLQFAIDLLPDKQKQVFVMRYYDEMKYEEISEILETSVGALKASYHHAAKKIAAFMQERLNRA